MLGECMLGTYPINQRSPAVDEIDQDLINQGKMEINHQAIDDRKRSLGALAMAYCGHCGQRQVFVRHQNGSWFTWNCAQCGSPLEEDCPICGRTEPHFCQETN